MQIDHAHLCEAVKAAVITCIQAVYRHQDPALSRVSEGRPWGSLEWAETISAVKRNAELLITRLTEDHCLLKPFNAHLNHIFSQNASPNLQRFSSLCRCIVAEVLPAFISRAIADDIKPQLELLANVAVAELYTSWQPEVVSRIQRLDGTLGGCVISTFVHCIQRDTQQWLLKLPQDFKLEEDRRTQQERAALKETISRLETAHKQISSIEDAFCTADPASSAFVAAVDAASRHTIADQHNLCS